jgi:hypothetical protein
VWLEGFAGFDEGFEAGEDAGPAVGGVGLRSEVLTSWTDGVTSDLPFDAIYLRLGLRGRIKISHNQINPWLI